MKPELIIKKKTLVLTPKKTIQRRISPKNVALNIKKES